MTKQTENETLTPQEFREFLLAELEASRQSIAELSDEQLEEIVGSTGYRMIAVEYRVPGASSHLRGPYPHPAVEETSIDLSGPPASSSSASGSPVAQHPNVTSSATRNTRVTRWLLAPSTFKRSYSAHF